MFYFNERLATNREDLESYAVPTIEELRLYKKNAVGSKWFPIHHLEMVRMIERVLMDRGFSIKSEQLMFGSSRKIKSGINRHNLYGYFVIEPDPDIHPNLPDMDGYERVLAFRHSNVQDFSIKILSGARVDLCENGMANGEFVIDRKHTSGVNLYTLIGEGISAWEGQQMALEALIASLHNLVLTPEQACFILVNAAVQDIVSSDKIVPIYGEYLDPVHEEWRNPTGWCLLQAVTQKAKSWGLARQEEAMHRMPAFILAAARAFEGEES